MTLLELLELANPEDQVRVRLGDYLYDIQPEAVNINNIDDDSISKVLILNIIPHEHTNDNK